MNTKTFWLIKILLVAAMYLVGFYLLDSLPSEMPMHWNAAGIVDSTWPKERAIWLIPSIILLMLVLFPVFAAIDPRKERYQQFRKPWEIFQLVFIIFFAYLHFVTLYITLHPQLLITPFMLGGLGFLFLVIGNYLGKIRQNYFVGIKTPWTLDNEQVWNKTHRLGGWIFGLLGITSLLNAYFIWHPMAVLLSLVAVAVILPVSYSYILYRALKKS